MNKSVLYCPKCIKIVDDGKDVYLKKEDVMTLHNGLLNLEMRFCKTCDSKIAVTRYWNTIKERLIKESEDKSIKFDDVSTTGSWRDR